ncbi:MAG TPA: hypothetical protein DCE41_24350 [Cytophagales bacterium]|nr:hypothetical protein [Cytophagales bacterium]HAA17773.1 hypothetical protein [Cytophagales bacterium]HAP59851.1 hypothetical protein [Cytophagales bacterium]
MPKHLFFICPTDHLEPEIHQAYRQEKVFYSSLGNSIDFDTDALVHLQGWIQAEDISHITFALSCSNSIVLDALQGQDYSQVAELQGFYDQLARQKEYTEGVWQSCNRNFLLLSHHLNNKMAELKLGLGNFLMPPLTIRGKIYNREEKTFCNVYSNLICSASVSIN